MYSDNCIIATQLQRIENSRRKGFICASIHVSFNGRSGDAPGPGSVGDHGPRFAEQNMPATSGGEEPSAIPVLGCFHRRGWGSGDKCAPV